MPIDSLKIQEIELYLRRLLINTIISKNGYSSSYFPDSVIKRATIRKRRRESPVLSVNYKESELIDYFNFGNYYQTMIYATNWESIFKKIFQDDKILYTKLHELEIMRNDLAHHRILSKEQSMLLNLNVKYLIRCIENNIESIVDLYDGTEEPTLMDKYRIRTQIFEQILNRLAGNEKGDFAILDKDDILEIIKDASKFITAEHIISGPDFFDKIRKIVLRTNLKRVDTAIIHIEGSEKTTLNEVREFIEKICQNLNDNCNITWGFQLSENIGCNIKLRLLLIEKSKIK